jgi:hypothetical protein
VALFSIALSTGAQSTILSGGDLIAPYGVALTAQGRVLLADYNALPPGELGAIFLFPRTGGRLEIVANGGLFQDPIAVARSFRGPIIVAEQDNPGDNGQVISVNPRTHAQRTLALAGATFQSPGGVAVVPPRCFGRFATIVGSPGADRLKGTRFPDVIAGAGGRDRLSGLGGRDRICGGKGRDRLSGGAGRDRLKGGPGRDSTRQ